MKRTKCINVNGFPRIVGVAVAAILGLAGLTTSAASAQQVLTCGDLIPGSIVQSGEADFFTFEAQAGDDVLLTLVVTESFGFRVTAQATLFDPTNGELLTFNANSTQRLTMPASGTYVVRVRADNLVSTGSYNLGLECLIPLSPNPTPLSCGDLVGGSIVKSGEADFFTFEAQAGDEIFLTLVVTGSFGFRVAAQATLFDPMGVELLTFNANSTQQFTIEQSGTHMVRVRADNLVSAGSYNLGLECLSPLSPDPTSLCCGALVGGSIVKSGEADFFTFEAQARDEILLTLVVTGSFGFRVTAQATLFDPTNGELLNFSANGTQRVAMPASGTYVVRVRADNLVSAGSYNLGMECLIPLSPDPTFLCCGRLVGGSIVKSGEVDFFTFEARNGDEVFLNLVVTGSFGFRVTAQATLFDPMNLELLTFNANSTQQFTIGQSGTYMVRVRADNLVSAGSYNLGMECLPLRPCGGVVIVEKQTLPDRAPDLFEFSGDAADSIADGGRIVVSQLPPGTYTSTEILPAGWNLTSIQCDDENSTGDISTRTATFQVEADETVKCTFTAIAAGHEAVLASSSPACDGSLPRSENNFVLLTFDRDIMAPTVGEIMIQEIMPGGATGDDLSANFTFAVCGNVLRITETVPSLVHRHWYRFTNMGGWAGVASFERDYVVLVGDADGNLRTLSADVVAINGAISLLPQVDSRKDIDGSGRVLSADVVLANSFISPLIVRKPAGHSCSP